MNHDARFVAAPDRVDVGLPYDCFLRPPAVAEAPCRRATRLPLLGAAVPAPSAVQRKHLPAEERVAIAARVAEHGLRVALAEFWADVCLHLLLANLPPWVEREVARAAARLEKRKRRENGGRRGGNGPSRAAALEDARRGPGGDH